MALYNKFFYNEVIRKFVIGFGSLFTNITVIRKDSTGNEIERETVPLSYAPKEKFIQRMEQDRNGTTKVAIKLPRMGFEITSYQYSPERKLSSKRKINQTIGDKKEFFYTPVPYDIDFDLYIFSKTQEEGLQIVEQIVPFFTPDYTITMKLTDLDTYKQDIPVSLVSVSQEDTYEGQFEERRSIIWTLSFRLKGYLIGPKRSANRILSTEVNLYSDIEEPPVVTTPLENLGDIYPTYTINTIEGLSGFSTSQSFSDFVDVGFSVELDNDKDTEFKLVVQDKILTNYDVSGSYRESLSSTNNYDLIPTIEDPSLLKVTVPLSSYQGLDAGIYIYTLTFTDNVGSDDFLLTGILIKN